MSFIVTFMLTFVILLAAIAAMGIGVWNGRAPLRGSCGGLNRDACEFCDGDCARESKQ